MAATIPCQFPLNTPFEGSFHTFSFVSPAQTRQELLARAERDFIGIVHIYNPENAKGGLTVAYRKSSPHKSGVMVDVAVHTCSTHDSFSKKIGTRGALEKFFDAETIQLPLLVLYDKGDIAFAVKSAFTVLYFTVT